MSAVITLSDSDDSDDLPCFADRVKQLLDAEKKQKNCIVSPKPNKLPIHAISESDDSDSRETIPFANSKNASPVCSLTNSPCKTNQGVFWSSDDEISVLHIEKAPSVNNAPNFSKHDYNKDSNDFRDLGCKQEPIFRNCQEPNFSNHEHMGSNDLPDLDYKPKALFRNDPEPNFFNHDHMGVNDLPDLDYNDEPLFRNSPEPDFLKHDHMGSNDLPDLDYNEEPLFRNSVELPKNHKKANDGNSSSDDEICIKKKRKTNKEKKVDPEKELNKQIRLGKKKEKELMRALKASEKEILKSQKPEESLKNMKIVIDHNVLYLEGSQSALNSLDQNNLTYCVEENNCKYSVNWYRKVINICTENNEILKEEREELEDTLIMIIPNEDFLKMIHTYVLVSTFPVPVFL